MTDITEENYVRVIYSKTARLFELPPSAPVFSPVVRLSKKGCWDYGRCSGTAFQLVTISHGLQCRRRSISLKCGDDLNEGKPTLRCFAYAPRYAKNGQR